jgi:N-methylhydantoinase B
MDPITLEIFRNLFISVAEEMGVTLGRTAYSPNIKERRDYSCACFLGDGQMIAQAAHIPVHLGAMPASVQAALGSVDAWAPGDLVMLNDPYLGGTHLPDITMVSPVVFRGEEEPSFFVASRAHHADVGGMSPGSMPLASEIYQEGLIIPPVKLVKGGATNEEVLAVLLRNVRTPRERRGDLKAQVAAHRVGERRQRLTRAAIRRIPDGVYSFRDEMDDGGIPAGPLAETHHKPGPEICVTVTVEDDRMIVDFGGSSPAVPGPLNAVRAITESATWYVARCVAGADVPVNSGTFVPVQVIVPHGSLLDADPPHAVAGGNVETSQRVVDCVLGALAQALPERIPAASLGTMNNLAIGGYDQDRGSPFAYYETVGGGAGAGPMGDGLSGVHVHMTNTLNTPVEALEYSYPFRIRRYSLRQGSGGTGKHRGGEGLVREIEFLCPAQVTILSERRRVAPYGLRGGSPGKKGRNILVRRGQEEELPGKVEIQVAAGDRLALSTPGGGGWGSAADSPGMEPSPVAPIDSWD